MGGGSRDHPKTWVWLSPRLWWLWHRDQGQPVPGSTGPTLAPGLLPVPDVREAAGRRVHQQVSGGGQETGLVVGQEWGRGSREVGRWGPDTVSTARAPARPQCHQRWQGTMVSLSWRAHIPTHVRMDASKQHTWKQISAHVYTVMHTYIHTCTGQFNKAIQAHTYTCAYR